MSFTAIYKRHRVLITEPYPSLGEAVGALQAGVEWGELFALGVYDDEAGGIHVASTHVRSAAAQDSAAVAAAARALDLIEPPPVIGRFPAFPDV